MSITLEKYIRKPFEVDAIRVTEENFDQVASWCDGKIGSDSERGNRKCIHVAVAHALNERQSRAFVGDWVLKASAGFKVYTNSAFEKTFDKLSDEPGKVVNNITILTGDKSPTPQQLADLVGKFGSGQPR